MQRQRSRFSAPTLGNSLPKFVVVGFYTLDTPYEDEINDLRRSCQQFGIHCHTHGYKNRGQWVKNAAIKPEFILAMMDLHPFSKVVYLDADARVKKYPELFDTLDADIAVHHKKPRNELLSGTIFLSPGARTKKLIEEWARQQAMEPETWDQKILARVLKDWKKPLRVAELPATYCQIFDTMKNAGDPVIEHLQASRRFKHQIESQVLSNIPEQLEGLRIRRSQEDGSYWIARGNQAVEKFMDEHCIRVPGTLRWTPRYVTDKRIENLRSVFSNKVCYIVGKGPSLDYLGAEHFSDPDAPIIALNEAIHVVEDLGLPNPLYAFQQDARLGGKCQPKRSPIFVSMKAANFYADYKEAYIFQNTELKLHPGALSVSAAITITKRLNTNKYILVCFDACINNKLEYAKCIGYRSTWGGKPERFLTHKAKIVRHARGTPIEWVIPVTPVVRTVDKSQQ